MRARRLSREARRGQAVFETRMARLRMRGERLKDELPNWALWGVGGAFVLVLAAKGLTSLTHNYLDVRRVQADMAELRKEEGDLSYRLGNLKADDVTLERIARHELGLMKTGEVEYRFTPPK